MTVRDAWSQLVSEVPAGATCHVASHGGPLIMHEGVSYIPDNREGAHGWLRVTISYIGPDIAERPATWYLGFFGDVYDRLVSHSDSAFDPIMPEIREVVSKYLAEIDGSELGAAVKALMSQAVNADTLVRVLVSAEAKRRAAVQGDS